MKKANLLFFYISYSKRGLPEKPEYMVDLNSDYLYEGKYCLESFMKSLDSYSPKKILKQLKKGKYFISNNWTFYKDMSTRHCLTFLEKEKDEKLEVFYVNI